VSQDRSEIIRIC